MAKAKKPDVSVASLGCVSALEFVGIRLSACVSLTTTDVARLLEALSEGAKPEVSEVYASAVNALRRRVRTLGFTAPIASCGRVKLTPDLDDTDVQAEFKKLLSRAKTIK